MEMMSMAISSLDKELINYLTQLSDNQKRSLLDMIRSFLSTQQKVTSPVTLEAYNKELEDIMERVAAGDFISFEDLKKEMDSW